MQLSIFLAKFLGIYMLLIAALLLFRREQVETSMKEMVNSPSMLAFTGFLSVLLGLAIVIGHPIWTFDWRGLITLLGFLSILRGLSRIIQPQYCRIALCKIFEKGYWISLAFLVILGSYLTYSGFTAIH
jgi:hypothetical protein